MGGRGGSGRAHAGVDKPKNTEEIKHEPLKMPEIAPPAPKPEPKPEPKVVEAVMSSEPIERNLWGSHASTPDVIAFHDDGEIGQAIKSMGSDEHLQVEGHALGNQLGRVATDLVGGQITAEQQIDRLKDFRGKVPDGSRAASALDGAIHALSAPQTPAPKFPGTVPEPLRRLAADLHAVPMVRRDPSREADPLAGIVKQFLDGRLGPIRLISEVRQIANRRHESQEGRFQIDRAVKRAVSALETMAKTNRSSLLPPGRK